MQAINQLYLKLLDHHRRNYDLLKTPVSVLMSSHQIVHTLLNLSNERVSKILYIFHTYLHIGRNIKYWFLCFFFVNDSC